MPTVEFQGTLHEFPDTFTDAQIGRALKGVSLRGQQDAARNELLPRLAGLMPAPDAYEEPARPKFQPSSFADLAGENAMRPEGKLPRAPRITAQDAARAFDVLGAAAEFARQGAFNPNASTELDERMARDVTPGMGSKIAAGVQQTAAGLADPEAIALMAATAGMGVLPKVLQRIGSGTFAAWMAHNAGQQAAELEQAIKDDDVEGAARATAGLGMDTLFAGLSAKHALSGIAKNSPRIAGWLSKKVAVESIPPAEVKAAYNRLERGMGTEADANLVRMVNEGFDRPGQAFRQGVTVEESSPRLGPAFREWLGVPETAGGRTVRLRDGREVVVNEETGGAEFPAQTPGPRPQTPRLLSPPETLPPEATPPSTAAPAPAGLPTTKSEPISSPLVVRPEAAMETRPSARWTPDAPREPAVDPDLAETIAALRAGYRPEVEKLPEPVAAPFPPYAEKLGIKSWQQAKKLGLDTIIADAPDMAREVVRAASNWIYASPERAAEHLAGEIVTKTRLLGGRDAALRSLANDYYQKAKGATEPGQQQRFNATAQALEALRAAKAAPAPPAKPTTPAPPTAKAGTRTVAMLKRSDFKTDEDWVRAVEATEQWANDPSQFSDKSSPSLYKPWTGVLQVVPDANGGYAVEYAGQRVGFGKTEEAAIKAAEKTHREFHKAPLLLSPATKSAATTAPRTGSPSREEIGTRPGELTSPPKPSPAAPLTPAEVSEFNALEQARRTGALDATGAARYRELEVRAGQGDFLAPQPKPPASETSGLIGEVESARLDKLNEANTAAFVKLTENQKAQLAVELGIRPIKATDAGILGDIHPDDLSAALNKVTGIAKPQELPQVSDDVTWKTGAGDMARSTVQRITKLPNDAEPMADVDWFGVKRVPVSQLQIVKKSSRRVAEEQRLTKANVPTTAKVTPAQAASASNPKFDFNPNVAKEQKKFLLDAVDKALAEAPDTSKGEIQELWQASEHYAAQQKLEDYTKANPYPDLPQRHNFGYTDAELAKFEEAKAAWEVARSDWEQRRNTEFAALAEPYLKEMTGGADVPTALTQGTELAFYRSLPHVTIEVPGDGVFSIVNTKDAIRDFKERAAKFPTTAARAKAPGSPKVNPSSVPALGEPTKENVLKAASLAVSTDTSRAVINTVWSDGKQTVATDGRRMHIFDKGVGGTEKQPVLLDAKGKPSVVDQTYPNWKQVQPKEADLTKIFSGQDAAKLWTVLKQADAILDKEAGISKSVKLWWNPDRTLGISSSSADVGAYEHNVQPNAKLVTALKPEFLMDALDAARKTGSEKVDVLWVDELSPVVIRGDHVEAIIMPMRLVGVGPRQFAPEMLNKYDLAKTPAEARAMMEKDLKALEDLRKPTGSDAAKADYLREQLGAVEDLGAEIARLEAKRKKEAAKPRKTNLQKLDQQNIDRDLQDRINALKVRQSGRSSSSASASPMTAGSPMVGSPPPLAGPPPLPHEEPAFSALPLGMPELVDLYKSLSAGQYPKVVQAIARLPWAAGVFRHNDSTGVARVELLAKLFKLLTPEEEAALLAQAREYAQTVAQPGDNIEELVRERYRNLLKTALEEAKRRGPVRAQQVLAHEIMHWIDWVRDHTLKRGNILGHIAAFKDSWLKHWLARDPAHPHGKPLTSYEKEKLRAEARKQMQAELGPMREIVRTILVEEPVWEIAGVKPEDVKNLFGMNAREELPELYLWFTTQPDAVKVEIVKAAMKGIVDERLAALGTKKQVGTKTIEKTVRERVGREPTPEEVAGKFQTLLRAEIRKRNLVELDTIKRELEATIAWYQGTPTMDPYFKTGIEMFAEAGSIWLNNPFALAQRAPTFHAALVNWLGHRPEVKRLYDQIQEDLRTGAHQDKRRTRLREMFKRGDEKGMERRHNSMDKPQFLDGVRYELDRVFGPVYRRAKGSALEGSVYQAVGDFRYRAAEQELFLSRENNEVGRLLAENALDWQDFGELLTYRRIVEERFDLANPLGITPKDALEGIERLKATLGPVRYGKLVEAAEKFNGLWQEMVVKPLVETGYVSPELADKMQGNTVYATFSVQRAQSEEGINRLLDMAFGAGIGPKIYRQMGTLQEIKNPATAAVLKGLSLISAVHRNTAKREVVKLMQEVDPELIREADQNWNGKRHEWVMKDTPHVGTVVVMNGGQPTAYYVPRTISDALNGADPMESQLAIAAIKANNALKALYTQLNYGFWPVNLMRDTGSFWLQMPGAMSPLRWAKNLPRSWRAAVSSEKGTPNADAKEALRRLMVISRAEYRGLEAADEHELTLESFGQTPADWDRTAKQQHLLMRAWLKYKGLVQTLERLNKINGMLYLDEYFPNKPEWQKQKIVRELAGSPDFLERSGSAAVNWAMMFYNPWKEGLHSLKAAAKADPWGFSFKTFALVMLPAVLQALAASGILGDERKKLYRSIPDYDLSNYWCVPLGWQNEKQGKAAYLRLPLPEPMRIMNGVIFHSLTQRGQGLMEYGAGQLPGLNSFAKVAMGWAALTAGQNPHDTFRGKDVVDKDTFEAGGLPVAAAMGKWTWNELGGGIIHRFRDPQLTDAPQENVEKFLQMPVVSNLLGRWVKVSSRGIDDQDRKLAEPVRQQRAQARVAVREMVRKFETKEPWGTEEHALINKDAYAAQYLAETLAKVLPQRDSLELRRWERRESNAERGAVFAPKQ